MIIQFISLLWISFIVTVDAGRLIQEDPSWSSKTGVDKPWIEEAPDYEVIRREVMVHSNPTNNPVEEIKAPQHVPESKVSPPTIALNARKRRRFSTSLPPSLAKKRRIVHNPSEIYRHRIMVPLERNEGNKGSNLGAQDVLPVIPRFATSPSPLELPVDYNEDIISVDPRGKRASAVWDRYPPHTIPELDRFFTKAPLTTPVYPYGGCFLSNGYQDNPQCYGGSVCVDKLSGTKVDCPNGPTGCPPCGPDGAPPPPPNPSPQPPGDPAPEVPSNICPKGCKIGAGCPNSTEPVDGICSDPKREDEEYDLSEEFSTTIRTPAVFYAGVLAKGAACSVYGDLIDETQKGDLNFADKSRRLKSQGDSSTLGGSMCNWANARLECIPNEPRKSTTTIAGVLLTDSDREAAKRIPGTCQCMLALGDEAVALVDPLTDITICHIPANKGRHSDCDHEIFPPYGAIEGVRRDGRPIHRDSEPAAKFCVPNSECRTGYKFTGLRCQCKKEFIWDPKTYSCSRATGLTVRAKETAVFKERAIIGISGGIQLLLFLTML